MRILITSVVDPLGSAHNRLHELIRSLARTHQVTLVSIYDTWKRRQVGAGRYEVEWGSLMQTVEAVPLGRGRLGPIIQEVLSPPSLLSILLERKGQFDLHLNYNTLVSGLVAAWFLRQRNVPSIYDLADDLPEMISMSPQVAPALRPLGKAVASVLVRWNAALASYITVTSSAIPLPPKYADKVRIVRNGVDTRLFDRRDSTPLKKVLGLDGFFVIGYVGVLREWVDLEPIYRALRTLRDRGLGAKLLVVGEEGGLGCQTALARDLGVESEVVFTGTVPYRQVPDYINCMDLGVIPFKLGAVADGAVPLKLFEYMACGVSVASSPSESIREVAGNRVHYVNDETALVRLVQVMREREKERESEAQEARAFVEHHFSWETSLTSLRDLVLEIESKS